MSLSARGRREKGHAFECAMAQEFQELGFDCITTRAAKGGNWCASDNGIDLCGTEPFKIQCKRFKDWAPISCIEEIQCDPDDGSIPLLLTKKDQGEVMAVLPFSELKKLIRLNYGAGQ